MFVQGQPVETCVRCANYLANIVIQRDGPTYPREKSSFII